MQDGTLTDSIAAVEAAWGKVADDLGLDRETIIAATHGKRAIDNLKQFRPEIQDHEMDGEVSRFEQSILDFADAYGKQQTRAASSSTPSTPSLTSSTSTSSTTSSSESSRRNSLGAASANVETMARPSFASRLSHILEEVIEQDEKETIEQDIEAAWELEADGVDRSVRILPGVRNMIDSIPDGHYAVATSGAKTYGEPILTCSPFYVLICSSAYGCMTRVGITPPPVTITADDKRLKAGKPAPDPFLLAAACLGFPASKCVVFEDSPSGIRAGVASGATVIALCTSHERSKIENCGAHFIVEDMSCVQCHAVGEGKETKLVFTVEH